MGVDLGGTKIEGIVLKGPRQNPTTLLRKRVSTDADRGYGHIVEQVVNLVQRLGEESGLKAPVPVGIGMPGSITREGLVKNSNTVCLNGTRFRSDVAKELGDRPTAFANDANCFALAEAVMGAGRGHDLVFGVIIGTGVGGGIVADGAVREGLQSIAGEWGHMVLRPGSDRICYCGQPGCVETYLAGPWVERHYRELSGETQSLADILALRTAGDPHAQTCIAMWLDHFGRAMANLINILDPDIVVLGGGVSNAGCLYGEGRDHVAKYLFSDELLTPIVRHTLGDSAGVFGAALL
ncbi:MAG: ROK family protein [Proteobacteria bacterium]|nr:ROK family protein [Pseudomonadota bacterium]